MKRNSRRARAALAAASALAVVASAVSCGNDSGSQGGTAKVAVSDQIPSLDPYTTLGFTVAKYAYDSLVNVTADGDVVSGLAAEWHATANSATFTLRPNVTCSDGTKLTAKHVAAVLTYASDPKNQLEAPPVILPSIPFTVTGDDATRTVKISMPKPYSFVLRTVGLLPIICPKGLKDPKSLAKTTDGTGPYKLASYSSAGPYVFSARKGYAWGPDGASTSADGLPSKIEISVVAEESTAANLLLTGGLSIATVSGSDRTRLAAADLHDVPLPLASGLTFFNQAKGRPLENAALRTGLVEALDRQEVANVVVGGKGTPGTDLRATNAVCHADVAGANLPNGDAMATLRAAGWTKVGGKLEKAGRQVSIRILHLSSLAELGSAAELMASTWQKLGIKVDILSQDANGFTNTLYQTGDWDVMVGSNAISLPSTIVPLFSGSTPPKGLNFSHVNNAEYARHVAQALTKQDTASCPHWQQASAALLKAADVLPVADGAAHYWGKDATFSLIESGANAPTIDPTSIRLRK